MIGHNPKATQSDDLQDVVALLQDLPQVSVPANFNASLQARLAAAKVEANEFADITALIKELPRVKAPADFDFRLRARLAQARAEQQKTSAGWWSELFGRTFSWAQAGAALAAVAIVVSVVTFGVLRSDPGVKAPESGIATASTTPHVIPNPVPSATQPSPVENKVQEPTSLMAKNNANESGRAKPYNAAQPSQPRPAIPPDEKFNTPSPQPPDAVLATTRTVIIKHRSGEARVVNLSEYNLGLQTANLRATPKPNSPKEQAFAANIF